MVRGFILAYGCTDSNPLLPGTTAFKLVARQEYPNGRMWQGETAHLWLPGSKEKEEKGLRRRVHLQWPISFKNGSSFHQLAETLWSYESINWLIYYIGQSLHVPMTFLLGLKKIPKHSKRAGPPDYVYDDILGSAGTRQVDKETERLLVDYSHGAVRSVLSARKVHFPIIPYFWMMRHLVPMDTPVLDTKTTGLF